MALLLVLKREFHFCNPTEMKIIKSGLANMGTDHELIDAHVELNMFFMLYV